MTKQQARKLYTEKRMQLPVADRNRFDDLLLIQFQKLVLPEILLVHTYLAMEAKKEFATDAILHYMEFQHPGVQFVIPRVNAETNELDNILHTEDLLFTTNSWGIAEPVDGTVVDAKEIDLVLVPLLAFDTAGNRVGYGKGYYDKLLAQCRRDVLKVGFSYFEPLDKIADSASFDIPLSYCVTPHRIYEFG
ncbi:5-formyltetrahydrofolate cyclo-ligase [Lacibacter sp. MH-610]|uniref:5-formyltetrahydrofolate cyclo-ligase n=1 Tax=Lacibacter sp. MH-610 TaxID=3020883 RepID=UPI0038924BF5